MLNGPGPKHPTPIMRPALLRVVALVGCASSVFACSDPDRGPGGDGDDLSSFVEDVASLGRVIENSTACVVDAVCFLQVEFADTSVVAVYGSGERPPPLCEIGVDVSDLAFRVEVGDLVEVVVSKCAFGGHYLQEIKRTID